MVTLPNTFNPNTHIPSGQSASFSETPQADFLSELEAQGYKRNGLFTIGKLVRIDDPTDKKGEKSGWAVYHENSDAETGQLIGIGVYGSWKVGDKHTWTSVSRDEMSPRQRKALDEQIKAAKKAANEEQERVWCEAAQRANSLWDEFEDAPLNHPYLIKKKIKPHGTKVNAEGELVIPVIEAGEIVSLQYVRADGKKFMPDGRTKGCYHTIGNQLTRRILIAEGFATAATVHEACGDLTYAAFNAGNLEAVALTVRKDHPGAEIVIAGDDDRWTDRNPGRTKADQAAKSVNGRAMFPEFASTEGKPTDFNDLYVREGIEAVQAQMSAPGLFNPQTITSDFDPSSIPQRPWLIQYMLLLGYLTLLIAPPGTGKSAMSILIAFMVALGRPYLPKGLEQRGNVLLINNEDDMDEIHRRVAGIMRHYQIAAGDLDGKLFLQSGYGHRLLFATEVDRKVEQGEIVRELIEYCRKHEIKLIIVDPFVSTHQSDENNNAAIEQVATIYRQIAHETGAAIMPVHHTPKSAGVDDGAFAGDMNASRGAASLIGAVRAAFTLARMSDKTAKELGVEPEIAKNLIRLDNAKQNFGPRDIEADWYELHDQPIQNGDRVGVPVHFDMAKIAERAEAKAAEEKAENNQVKASDIAKGVANVMTEDSQTQAEVVPLYKVETNKKRSTAMDDLNFLPYSRADALRIYADDGKPYRVWRERIGSAKSPRYTLHRMLDD